MRPSSGRKEQSIHLDIHAAAPPPVLSTPVAATPSASLVFIPVPANPTSVKNVISHDCHESTRVHTIPSHPLPSLGWTPVSVCTPLGNMGTFSEYYEDYELAQVLCCCTPYCCSDEEVWTSKLSCARGSIPFSLKVLVTVDECPRQRGGW